MTRKKILHFVSGLEVGGTETQLSRILPELQKYHENRVCCASGRGPIGKALEKKGITVYYLDLGRIYNIFAIWRFRKIAREFSPDILATYLIHTDLYGRVLGRLFGIKKIVCSKRGALLQWEWLSFFDRLTRKMVTHYLVQTKTARKEWMEKLRLPEKKFTIIPNGIDIESFRTRIDETEKKKQLGIKNSALIITCVSKLRRGKGHETLLKAFEKAYLRNNDIILLIVGDGEREDELKKSVAEYSSRANIIFLGFRKDISEILSVTDLFVLPTEKEGMSNAIIEAMIAGIPVITSDIPENRDLIENKRTGILFPVSDADVLAEKIEKLLADQYLREKIGRNAKLEAERKYNIQTVVEQLADFFEEL